MTREDMHETGAAMVWFGQQRGDQLEVLALAGTELVLAMAASADAERVQTVGPAAIERRWGAQSLSLDTIDRVRTHGETGLKIHARGGDPGIGVRFESPPRRDQVLGELRALLAPDAPLVPLRRPRSHFVEVGSFGVFILLVGLGLPWAVDAGHVDRSQWLVATLFNWLGPNGFRLVGLALAAVSVAAIVVMAVNNREQTGFLVDSETRR